MRSPPNINAAVENQQTSLHKPWTKGAAIMFLAYQSAGILPCEDGHGATPANVVQRAHGSVPEAPNTLMCKQPPSSNSESLALSESLSIQARSQMTIGSSRARYQRLRLMSQSMSSDHEDLRIVNPAHPH